MAAREVAETFAVLGDVHGHLQLALCTLARWQRERGLQFSAVFLCGDVGTFTDDAPLDSATVKHAKNNPCELEFLTQWSTVPPAPWLDHIFRPEPEGLGLCCPVVMVHGNHEGFAHLETLYPRRRRPTDPVPIASLPPVDTEGRIQYLPSGWSVLTEGGRVVAGVGGIETGQRRTKYHEMAYIEDDAVQHALSHWSRPDVLITHQGPAHVQGEGHGSVTLDALLESQTAAPRFWFHGHSTPIQKPQQFRQTQVIPLGDLAFSNGTPGLEGWSILQWGGDQPTLTVEPPSFWREVRLKHWHRTPAGLLIHPDLMKFAPRNSI